ncbi:morphogenic membrane protein MmpB [Streptacidiphilus albus]|nr:hypothetical protein [Streptacidiphilus albus]
MLWSDPVDDTVQEKRRIQALLQRLGAVVAVFAVVLLIIVMA